MWEVQFYDEKVKTLLERWPNKLKVKFLRIVELLEKHGPFEVGMPLIKNMGKSLWEIRAQAYEAIGRACFCIVSRKQIIIVHAFIKKTQETPKRHLELALKRATEVMRNERFKL